jgi:hypothetical protein
MAVKNQTHETTHNRYNTCNPTCCTCQAGIGLVRAGLAPVEDAPVGRSLEADKLRAVNAATDHLLFGRSPSAVITLLSVLPVVSAMGDAEAVAPREDVTAALPASALRVEAKAKLAAVGSEDEEVEERMLPTVVAGDCAKEM